VEFLSLCSKVNDLSRKFLVLPILEISAPLDQSSTSLYLRLSTINSFRSLLCLLCQDNTIVSRNTTTRTTFNMYSRSTGGPPPGVSHNRLQRSDLGRSISDKSDKPTNGGDPILFKPFKPPQLVMGSNLVSFT
jgi:hypothetical protein